MKGLIAMKLTCFKQRLLSGNVRMQRRAVTGAIGCILTLGTSCVQAQLLHGMLDPAIDPPDQPFSYFWHPTDVLGTLYAPVASEVTPEGYIYTGFGELMFFTGNPVTPVDQRIKTLEHGYLPIIQYEVKQDGLTYRFSMVATDVGGPLSGVPINLIRVTISNETSESHAGFLASAFRIHPPQTHLDGSRADYRFSQRLTLYSPDHDFNAFNLNADLIPKRLTAGQWKLDPNWKYSYSENSLIRDGSVLYTFPKDASLLQTAMAVRDSGVRAQRYLSGQIEARRSSGETLWPDTPMGFAQYRIALKPGEEKILDFKLPLAPLPQSSPESELLSKTDYDSAHKKEVSLWNGLVEKKSPIQIPEEKVQQSLVANTIYSLLAIDKVGDDYIPTVNKFQYHDYFPTDTSLMAVALDDMGQTDIAGNILLYATKEMHPDGNLSLEWDSQMWETFGHIMWAWNRHYVLTHDKSFLKKVYPFVVKAMSWEINVTTKDAFGVMPPCSIYDDAWLKDTRQTGQDLWTLDGILGSIEMAKSMGKKADEERFKAEYKRFREAFDKTLAVQTAKTGGYVPPSLDNGIVGNDWDNLHLLYPVPLYDPSDPRVAATDTRVRATFKEGILPYVYPLALSEENGKYTFDETPRLHYWHTPDITQNELVRGRTEAQKEIVGDLYALLLHTTSTHAMQEFGTYPWGTRDYMEGNILPDGSSSAVLVELIRNMLVREYKDELHLFSAVSPDWLQAGKSIEIDGEPTNFGPVDASLRITENGLAINLANQFHNAPAKVIVHVPWFYEATGAKVDGRSVKIVDGKIEMPSGSKTLSIAGKIRTDTPDMNYANAVKAYKAEYAVKYAQFLKTGEVTH